MFVSEAFVFSCVILFILASILIISIYFTFSFLFSRIDQYIREFADSFCDSKNLKERWLEAKASRLSWKSNHPYADFNSIEYQELWEMELGAEILYLLKIGSCDNGPSWNEYKQEKMREDSDYDD